MLKLLLQISGWTVAHTPGPLLRVVAGGLGAVIWRLPRRRRVALSNLSHAFPGLAPAEARRLARASSRRLVETGLLSLATPFLTVERLRRIVRAHPSLLHALARHPDDGRAMVMASPHLSYWETQACFPLTLPVPAPETGVIFRPVDNPALDAWVKRSRERFGLSLLSRKSGFQEALQILGRRGIVAILFDQNAGLQGALTTLFGRVCSTTELPGLLAAKHGARVCVIFPRRLAFWRVELAMADLETDGTAAGVTIALNRWLEQKLAADADLRASWLWAHERWKNQDIPAQRLRLLAKRNILAADCAARGWARLPRNTRIWIRVPNWLGDVIMALPLLRAIRQGRPDAALTLVAQPAFHPLLRQWNLAEHIVAPPSSAAGWWKFVRRARGDYPDLCLLFTNSLRGDLEARLTGCRQRFGLVRPGKWRPLLSHAWRVPADFDERQHHQLELWTRCLAHFGLEAPADTTPVATHRPPARPVIGLVPGSENQPAKRWPASHWRELITGLPADVTILLFGTTNDRPLTGAIARSCGRPVENLAGRTTLPEYCARLSGCTVLVTNDTGGMHLANALGVPLIALFGPTNPLRTGPVFSGPVRILQPPGCAPAGGGALADLPPAAVLAALRSVLPPAAGTV